MIIKVMLLNRAKNKASWWLSDGIKKLRYDAGCTEMFTSEKDLHEWIDKEQLYESRLLSLASTWAFSPQNPYKVSVISEIGGAETRLLVDTEFFVLNGEGKTVERVRVNNY
jgi:threonyl-tRNA synthetase